MKREQQELAELLKVSPKTGLAVSQAVALVIRTAQQAIEQVGLTEADVTQFLDEAVRTETLMPLVDPTGWLRGGQEAIDEGKARGGVVRRLLALPARGPGLLDSNLLTAGFRGEICEGYIVAPAGGEETPI